MINVLSVAQTLVDMGVLTDDESKKAMPFCISAADSISRRLKSTEYEDNLQVIIACGAIALYNYVLLVSSSPDEPEAFSVGDVQVTQSSAAMLENAVKFRDEAMANASRFLKDIDFMFEAVEA